MSIPIPSGMARGKVTWRIGHDRAGTTLPGASGTVRFEPTARAVSYASTTVLPEPVETPVVAGVMTPVDLQVNDPAVWSWRVCPMLGVEWPPFVLDVPAAGVDVARVAVVEASVPTRLVTAATLSEWRAALDGKVDATDARLTDARTPTAHQHAVADVDGLTARLAALEYDSGSRDVPLLTGTGGTLRLRRIGRIVEMSLVNYRPVAGDQRLYQIPAGFRPSATVSAIASDSNAFRTAVIFSYAPFAVELRAVATAGTWINMQATWTTGDSIPTTLPGTPA